MHLPRVLAIWAVVVLSCCGCSPEKAAAVKSQAIQFDTAAQAAISSVADGENALTVQPELPDADQAEAFETSLIKEFNKKGKTAFLETVTVADIVEAASSPAVDATKNPVGPALNRLRAAYSAFADIYTRLPEGSWFSAEAVRESIPLARRLTVQLAQLAKFELAHPPHYLARRLSLKMRLRDIFANNETPVIIKQKLLRTLYFDWHQLEVDEQQLASKIVKDCLAAAKVGLLVVDELERYDTITLEDIKSAIAHGFSLTERLRFVRIDVLKDEVNKVMTEIQSDPELRRVLDEILRQAQHPREEATHE